LGDEFEVISVPSRHGFIMNSRQVAEIVGEILGNRRHIKQISR